MSDTKFEPDYTEECDNCGQSPTVTVVENDTGNVVQDFGMCGPCMFGEAKCIDPEEW